MVGLFFFYDPPTASFIQQFEVVHQSGADVRHYLLLLGALSY